MRGRTHAPRPRRAGPARREGARDSWQRKLTPNRRAAPPLQPARWPRRASAAASPGLRRPQPAFAGARARAPAPRSARCGAVARRGRWFVDSFLSVTWGLLATGYSRGGPRPAPEVVAFVLLIVTRAFGPPVLTPVGPKEVARTRLESGHSPPWPAAVRFLPAGRHGLHTRLPGAKRRVGRRAGVERGRSTWSGGVRGCPPCHHSLRPNRTSCLDPAAHQSVAPTRSGLMS